MDRIVSASVTLGAGASTTENLNFSFAKGSSGANNHNGWTVAATGASGFSVSAFDGRYVTMSRGADSFTVDLGKTLTEPSNDDIQYGGFSVGIDISSGAVNPVTNANLIRADGRILTDAPPEYLPSQLWIQSGANSGQGMHLQLFDCRIETLGIEGISVTTRDAANHALRAIDNALGIISMYRATAGAQQNRLEFTLKNLNNAEENMAASESRIRDVDMALEMMTFVRNQILMSASTAMLAQANQNPQSVLQLLS